MKAYFCSVLAWLLVVTYNTNAQQVKPLSPKITKIQLQEKFKNLFKCDTVQGDPLKTRVYTFSNGFTVFLSVVKDQPKIQAYVVVKAGSKHDPPHATGLAHYLEHMLFKGTDQFGTIDYSKEKPYLDKIEELYETYRNTTDEIQRKKIYKTIDSLSGVAAQYAIANEYDKMMASIGGQKSNAYTWFDQTVYFEQIPANQLVNWLKIQSERFRNPVMRLFHTELEAVYEEKNISMDDDYSQVMETLFASLFPSHTYGTQTTIGTVEHLKNPSIKEIKNFYKKYYVPNNMGLVLVGDFNPDIAIQSIALAFAPMVKTNLEELTFEPQPEIKTPITKEVFGPEAESVSLAFRLGGANTNHSAYLSLITELLSNKSSGLLDENIVKAQKALSANAYYYTFNDYSVLFLEGKNKSNQTPEELKDLLLNELNKIAQNQITDDQFEAVKINLILKLEQRFDNIETRGALYVDALVKKQSWATYWNNLNKFKSITKQELVDFCKNYIKQNYVVVYKRMGNNTNVTKITKPEITPVVINSTAKSDFFKKIESAEVIPLQPSFVNFATAINNQKLTNGQEIWQVKNNTNNLFKFYIALPLGKNDEPLLDFAFRYLSLAGSKTLSANQIEKQLYQLGCSWNVILNNHQGFIEFTGLNDNFKKCIELMYQWFTQPAENQTVLNNLINDYLKEIENLKSDKTYLLQNGLFNYALYGNSFKEKLFLTASKAKSIQINDLINLLNKVFSTRNTYLYYGNSAPKEVYNTITNTFGKSPNIPYTPSIVLASEKSSTPRVLFINYEMNQAELLWVSELHNLTPEWMVNAALYNEYFGVGMASIVFQTLRESKALAYSARSAIQLPERKKDNFYNIAYIGTQADKLPEAITGMNELLKQMPLNAHSFEASKKALLQKIISSPLIKEDLLLQHYKWLQLDIKNDFNETLYNQIQTLDLKTLNQFHQKHIKPLQYDLLIVGDKSKLDLNWLNKQMPITELTPEQIFGN
jgi:predicted Zn-dependent peptidase